MGLVAVLGACYRSRNDGSVALVKLDVDVRSNCYLTIVLVMASHVSSLVGEKRVAAGVEAADVDGVVERGFVAKGFVDDALLEERVVVVGTFSVLTEVGSCRPHADIVAAFFVGVRTFFISLRMKIQRLFVSFSSSLILHLISLENWHDMLRVFIPRLAYCSISLVI